MTPSMGVMSADARIADFERRTVESALPARARWSFAVAAALGLAAAVLLRAFAIRRAELAACEFFGEPCTVGGLFEVGLAELQSWQGWLPQHAALVVASATCARGLRPSLFCVPAGVFVLGPVLWSGGPNPLLSPLAAVFPNSTLAVATGGLLAVAMITAPAALLLDRPYRLRPAPPSLAILTAVGLLAVIVLTRSSVTGVSMSDPATSVVVASFTVGLLARRSQLVLAVTFLIPVLLSWNDGSWHPSDLSSLLILAWPFAALTVGRVAADVELLLHRYEPSPLILVVLVNVLNLADAVATQLALSGGAAVEANPVVRAVGLPAKALGVAVASVLIARWRPRVLLVPIAVLTLVAAWHIGGLLTNG